MNSIIIVVITMFWFSFLGILCASTIIFVCLSICVRFVLYVFCVYEMKYVYLYICIRLRSFHFDFDDDDDDFDPDAHFGLSIFLAKVK